MIELELVTRALLRGVWPAVRGRIEQMLAAEPQRWIAEDVFVELMSNSASLYWVLVGGVRQGFMVARARMEYDTPVLFVWLLDVAPHTIVGGFHDAMLEPLDALAKSIGAKVIRHESTRAGWAAKGMFDLKLHVYEREVK
jgi:hypothetical protein